MLRRLRLQLTLLYLAVAIGLLVLVAGGSYRVLSSFFESSTDEALRAAVAQQFAAIGAPVPPELAVLTRSSATASRRGEKRDDDDHDSWRDPTIAAVVVLPSQADGRLAPGASPSAFSPNLSSLLDALRKGSDLRTVSLPNGGRARILTYRIDRQGGPAALQAGRYLDD